MNQTLRCFSRRTDVSLVSPAPPLGPTNISDTGEMGASTPAPSGRFGCRPFHPAPAGSRELRRNTGMARESVLSPRATSTEERLQRAAILKFVCGESETSYFRVFGAYCTRFAMLALDSSGGH